LYPLTISREHEREGWRGESRRFGEAVAILIGDLAHSYAETARYIGMCQLLGLQTTGGADFHGHPGSAPPGAFGISSEGLAALRARRRSGPAPAAVLGSGP
jgi:hypothetical protein